MKYLKTYEAMADLDGDSYLKQQERLRFLEDMSLELRDEKFNVQVRSEILSRDDKYIVVSIQKRGSLRISYVPSVVRKSEFYYKDIKDVFLSMVSYMESEGHSIRSIEVSDISSSNLIKYKLVDEVLLTDMAGIYTPRELNHPIGQLIIKFKE